MLVVATPDHPWPPRSPDLTAADFFLWGYLKEKVYSHEISSIRSLKLCIKTEVKKMNQNKSLIEKVYQSFRTRINDCIKSNGKYLDYE